MGFPRFAALALALVLPARAAEEEGWLVPPVQKAAPGQAWRLPCHTYLLEEIPALTGDETYAAMADHPALNCTRGEFFSLLALVLSDASVSLPEINAVTAVPDCQEEAILDFYRWGVLGGKDDYGTLEASTPLTRAAAAAGQTWQETHIRLVDSIIKAQGSFPEEDLPEAAYAPAWDTLNLTDLSPRVAQLPYWGGTA